MFDLLNLFVFYLYFFLFFLGAVLTQFLRSRYSKFLRNRSD